MKYRVVSADNGAVTIIDNETNINILAIDHWTEDGIVYTTPVFAEEEIARRVLDALNKKEAEGG